MNLGTILSEFLPITKGVPQGSVLGPDLFIIYIINIVPFLTSCYVGLHLYADDTILYHGKLATFF